MMECENCGKKITEQEYDEGRVNTEVWKFHEGDSETHYYHLACSEA